MNRLVENLSFRFDLTENTYINEENITLTNVTLIKTSVTSQENLKWKINGPDMKGTWWSIPPNWEQSNNLHDISNN